MTVKTYWPANLGVEIDRVAGGTELNWTHTDRLDSVIGITDSWGKRRTLNGAPVNGTPTPDNLDGVTDNKGFTGHEMLDQLDLVHMNGRIYDPLVARMMSADPYIQDPLSSKSYNRYTYVWNNPTNLTDPTGCSAMAASTSQYADKDGNCDKRCQQLEDDLERESLRINPFGKGVQSNSRSADNTGGAGAANSVGGKVVRSPDYLRALVPGEIQWDDARTDFVNGHYGGAALHTGLMVGEQVLTVLTFGKYQGARAAAQTTTVFAENVLAQGAKKLPALRRAYVNEVRALEDVAFECKSSGRYSRICCSDGSSTASGIG
ncbi:RHS repeat domain-containing protein [Undibacterium squillarum]|uniref:RHS repeat-associated core domain-containing protein n=1 Tax=Undibacterium squillarum TaxID=1131567 RepID=A0ABQ2XPT1_9BURK|nr:RHS repeat-associated core domain-containing protein [Undibacterium squillarum]GGX28214.1 hypothetical protein GCM10010946_01220 [Undibacterium squillarum]